MPVGQMLEELMDEFVRFYEIWICEIGIHAQEQSPRMGVFAPRRQRILKSCLRFWKNLRMNVSVSMKFGIWKIGIHGQGQSPRMGGLLIKNCEEIRRNQKTNGATMVSTQSFVRSEKSSVIASNLRVNVYKESFLQQMEEMSQSLRFFT